MAAKQSLYPEVNQSHPDLNTAFLANPNRAATASPGGSLYPSVDPQQLAENLFPDAADDAAPPPPTTEEALVAVPGAQLHLVDPDRSMDLGAGTLSVVRLRQGDHSVAVLARLVPEKRSQRRGGLFGFLSGGGKAGDGAAQEPVQWPLTRDVAAVKLDTAHYFFSLHVPHTDHEDDDAEGPRRRRTRTGGGAELRAHGRQQGQEAVLAQLDKVLEEYTTFSVKQVEPAAKEKSEVMDTKAVTEIMPEEAVGDKKEVVEEQSAAFWTTIAPNVDDYSSSVARLIARGSGQLVRGIIWCGDITAEGLRCGEAVVKKSVGPSGKPSQVKPSTIRRMKRYGL